VKDVHTLPAADIDSDHNLLVARICTRLKKIITFHKRKRRWDLEKLYAQLQELHDSLEEKLGAINCESGNVEVQCTNIKKCVLDTMSDLVGKVERRARKPWITQEMISKMDEQRKWKNVNNEEGRKNYGRLRNELKRVTDNAKKEYMESICDKIIEFQRTGRYDLMYMKTKELGFKENHGIQNIGIEVSQGNIIIDQRRVLQIWEKYSTEFYDRANRPEQLEVEPEDEVDEDEKGPYTLQSEVEKAIKEMKDKKATGDDVPGDVLKLLGEGGLRLMTQMINSMYVTREWPRDSIEVTMIALKKKPKSTKYSDHHTISIIAHAAKIVARLGRKRIERKTKDALGEDEFGFRRGKGTSNAIGMLRIISEGTVDIDEELRACFIHFRRHLTASTRPN
jgi:hypothetical protein